MLYAVQRDIRVLLSLTETMAFPCQHIKSPCKEIPSYFEYQHFFPPTQWLKSHFGHQIFLFITTVSFHSMQSQSSSLYTFHEISNESLAARDH